MDKKMTIRQWLDKHYHKLAGNKDALVEAGIKALGVGKTSFLNKVADYKKNVVHAKATK